MLRKAGALAFIPLLLMFAATTYRWGVADIYAAQAQSHIKVWLKSGELPDEQEWTKVQDMLVTSLAYNSGNPAYLERLGELYLTRSLGFFLDDEEATETLGYFSKVIALRPSWPYGWANLVMVSLASDDLNQGFLHALERAAALGSWESKVQRVVAEAGFSVWMELDESARQTVLHVIRQGLYRQAYQIVRIAISNGELEIVCSLMVGDGRMKYCQDYE